MLSSISIGQIHYSVCELAQYPDTLIAILAFRGHKEWTVQQSSRP